MLCGPFPLRSWAFLGSPGLALLLLGGPLGYQEIVSYGRKTAISYKPFQFSSIQLFNATIWPFSSAFVGFPVAFLGSPGLGAPGFSWARLVYIAEGLFWGSPGLAWDCFRSSWLFWAILGLVSYDFGNPWAPP